MKFYLICRSCLNRVSQEKKTSHCLVYFKIKICMAFKGQSGYWMACLILHLFAIRDRFLQQKVESLDFNRKNMIKKIWQQT